MTSQQTSDGLGRVHALVRDTFGLWDVNRVGFSWRNYYLEHTLRVRNLCLRLGREEGADRRLLDVAALLHDITKRYDGGILTDANGKRILDQFGFWRNELVLPARQNIVTRLYQHYDQFYELHSLSGAKVGWSVLDLLGFSREFSDAVAEVVGAHVKPDKLDGHWLASAYRRPESRILCDADTIDSNLGLVAFYRNVEIHTYHMVKRSGKADLHAYVDSIPRWLQMKHDFLSKLMTDAGRRIGQERQQRNLDFCRLMLAEKDNFDLNRQYGLLGVFDYFMSRYEDPNLDEEMRHLAEVWIPERRRRLERESNPAANESLDRAIAFHDQLAKEIAAEL